MGYEFYPEALGSTIRRAWEVTGGVPILVTENGIGTTDDDQRLRYLHTALDGVLDCIDDGIQVDGLPVLEPARQLRVGLRLRAPVRHRRRRPPDAGARPQAQRPLVGGVRPGRRPGGSAPGLVGRRSGERGLVSPLGAVGADERASWDERGFFRLDRFADPSEGEAMLECVLGLVRSSAAGDDIAPALVMPEQQADMRRRDRAGAGRVEGVPGGRHRPVPPVPRPSRRARPGGRPRRHGRGRLLLQPVHLQEPGRVGPALAPGLVLLPLRATPADRRPVAGGHRGHARERMPARARRVERRARARAHPRSPAGRQLRLRRDRRSRHGRQRAGAHGPGRSARVRQPPHAPVPRQHQRRARAAMVFHFAAAGTVDHTQRLRGYTIHDWLPVGR